MTTQLLAVHPIVFHPDGRRVLRAGDDWPRLELSPDQDMVQAVQAQWGLAAWLLHAGGFSIGRTEQPRLQALSDGVPDGMHWEEAQVPSLPHARPWQLPGWPTHALGLDGALKTCGLTRQTGPFLEQSNDLACVVRVGVVRAGVVRAGTKAGPAYFKVSDSPHEAAITRLLFSTLPELLPPVLWSDPASNSLLTFSGGELLDGVADVEVWLEAVRRLARFQTGADANALAALGCPSFVLVEMAERVDALLSDRQALSDWGLETGQLVRLSDARPAIRAAFRELAALNLPELPAHGDAHPRNALSGGLGPVWFDPVWFDWAEAASAAHPFMDAGWFLAFTFHPARSERPVRTAHPDLEQRLTRAYLAELGCPDAAPVLGRAAPLALLQRAVIYDTRFRRWEGTLPGWRPNFVPYYLRLAVRELARVHC